ncbi:MAG: hypothetical protein LBD48_01330 [Treponema sp.]|jgi:hypothetical protein|nr:hypothetical protein [Treponema sp.]
MEKSRGCTKLTGFCNRLSIAVFLFVVIPIGVSAQQAVGFDNSEAVLHYFANSLRQGNIDDMLKACAFWHDDNVSKLDSKEYSRYTGFILPQINMHLPSQYDALVKADLISRFAFQIKYFIFGMLLPPQFNVLMELNPVLLRNEEFITRFERALDLSNVKDLEIVRADVLFPDWQFDENHTERIEILKRIYGYTDRVEYFVLYKCNAKLYLGFITAVQYDSKWYVFELRSDFLNSPLDGRSFPISDINEYLDIISGSPNLQHYFFRWSH